MSRRLIVSARFNSNSSRPFTTESFVDHYAVLGVNPGATAKEIKAAFYNLSKKYHPDRNKDNKAEAASKFHQVSLAYEVLGSDERRRMYDMTRIRTSSNPSGSYRRPSSTYTPKKQYTDVDIDYKSFEHFQRLNRQRKQYHPHFEMPKEFYAAFGGKERQFKSVYEPPGESVHKDSRARQREEEELHREMQREKERQQAKYPIPTFEQMMQEKRQKERERERKQLAGALGLLSVAAAAFMVAKKFFR